MPSDNQLLCISPGSHDSKPNAAADSLVLLNCDTNEDLAFLQIDINADHISVLHVFAVVIGPLELVTLAICICELKPDDQEVVLEDRDGFQRLSLESVRLVDLVLFAIDWGLRTVASHEFHRSKFISSPIEHLRQLELLWWSVEHALVQVFHFWPSSSLFDFVANSENTGLSDESLRRERIDCCVSAKLVAGALLDPVQFPVDLVHAYHL